jgi:acetyltransferase-like isoleucine patch superfamily enzyme
MFRNAFTVRALRRLDHALQKGRWEDRLKHLRAQATVHPTAIFDQAATVDNNQANPGAIHIGDHTHIHGQLLVYRHGGKIRLGSYVFMGPGSRIWSAAEVTIGNHVLISHNVNIHDNDSHPMNAAARREQYRYIFEQGALPAESFGTAEAPVRIGDDAWIGLNAIILKGVTIGEGAIVGAGSVVTRDVEAFTVVTGNPATFQRKLPPT